MTPEIKLHFTDLRIDRKDLFVELGYGDAIPQVDVMEIIDEVWKKAEDVARPCFYYKIEEGSKTDRLHIQISGTEFLCGSIIGGYLDEVERFAVFVTTAGNEYDVWLHELKASGDLVTEYIADALGSVIAEAVVTKIGNELSVQAEENNETVTYPYSPGYCGWHVREQVKLFGLFPENVCGVRLTESCLMVPVKSVSGVFGIGRNIQQKAYACDICSMKTCYKRNQKKSY